MASAGGFMPMQSNIGGFGATSPSGGGYSQSAQNDHTPSKARWGDGSVRPVTVAQLNAAVDNEANGEEEGFSLDGRALSRVALVGEIVQVAPQGSNTVAMAKLSDGTGSIDVFTFIDNDNALAADAVRAKLVEGSMVKVVGTLRAFQAKRSVRAQHVVAVTDHNIVTYHLLAAIAATKAFASAPATSFGTTGGFAGGLAAPTSSAATSQYGSAAALANAGAGMSGAGFGTGNPVHAKILSFIRAATSSEGASVSDICTSTGLPQTQVRAALDSMEQEGQIYSTVDEDHFTACS